MSLLARDPSAPKAWHDPMPVSNRYTFGLAGERFFRTLKEAGKIMGSRCDRCEVDYVPARQFCERCMDELEDWFDAGTGGEVYAFTHVSVDTDGDRLEESETIAFVRMADGGIIHRLGEIDRGEIQIGMRVQAVLKPQAEREGSIQDILHFKPV